MLTEKRRNYAAQRLRKLVPKLVEIEYELRSAVGERREQLKRAKRSTRKAHDRWCKILEKPREE